MALVLCAAYGGVKRRRRRECGFRSDEIPNRPHVPEPSETASHYKAIIRGARGLNFFGGNLPVSLSPADAKLGWNWTFWQRVLRPLLEEIGRHGPLHPALVAPNSMLPVKVSSPDIEFCVREVGSEVFILACRRGGPTSQVEFDGLPTSADEGEVLFESPRRVTVKDGQFTDWFAPFELHVYRFQR